jgi:predicted exporter
MLVTWLATVTVLPALWALLDRGPARRRSPWSAGTIGPRAAGALARWPRRVLAVGAAITLLALAALPRWLDDPFEYDLAKLRNRAADSTTSLSRRIAAVFGETTVPLVILAERLDEVPEIRARAAAQMSTPDGKRLITAVRTIGDFVPSDQTRKLAVLAEIRSAVDDIDPEDVDDAETARALRELRPPDALAPITVADLPATVRDLFTEVDGTVGRMILVYDVDRLTSEDGRAQLALAGLVGEIRLSDGSSARCPVLFAALLDGITHDVPIASALSLLGVIALVAAYARGRGGTLRTVAALVVGVVWMVGAAAWLDLRVSFINFIALPITFGIGVDYGINMWRRIALEGPGGLERAVRATGGALLLCSSTTVIGYGSLLAAHNQALRGFGLLAILGELATVTAALTLLPASAAARSR